MRFDFKYVVADVDRHGNTRIYFRRTGQPKIRLPGVPGSEEFIEAYRKALSGAAPVLQRDELHRHKFSFGSLGWLCVAYKQSAEFQRLDPRTQSVRRNILDNLCRRHGEKPVQRMEPRHVRALRDERTAHPEAANAIVKALRQVFAFGIEADLIVKNPAREVAYLHNGSEGFHSWTQEEINKFEERHPLGTRARLALGLLLLSGQRLSDIIHFGRQHVRDGWLKFTQQKNRRKNPITLEIPVVPELQKIIDNSPCGDLTFLVTKFGRPFTAAGFGNRFRAWCDEAALPQCSAHGLRKAAAARLAELGATEHEIMAVTGHRTSKEVVRYTRAANQKLLAGRALARLTTGESENKSVPPEPVVRESGTKSKAK